MTLYGTCTECSVDAEVSRVTKGGTVGAFARMAEQSSKCRFGQMGVCCRLCTNGPCRITEKSPRGVCGADGDAVVARNFLRSVAAGAACYLHVAENSARAIIEAAGGFNPRALDRAAARLGIPSDGRDAKAVAREIADVVLADLYSSRAQSMKLVDRLAPEKERARWAELGLLPGGAKAEVFDALVKTSTNLNSNTMDMLLHCLRLGIATGYYGLVMTNMLNDVLLGDPEIAAVPCGLGTINPQTLNVAITGHQQAMAARGFDQLIRRGLARAAGKAGAEGVRIVGLTCVGQDFQSRSKANSAIFTGHAGDNFTAEAALLTGAIDLIISDFNCTLAGLDVIAREQAVPELCVDDVAMLPGAVNMPHGGQDATALDKIIEQAVAHFAGRKGAALPLPESTSTTLTGLTENSLPEFLGGTLTPVLGWIKEGRIRGLAGVVGCSNLVGGHGLLTAGLTRELIARDILVLSAGCTSGVLGNCNLMNPAAAELAGPKLRSLCKEAGIPPVLNFGPCLGIGRIEEVAQAAAQALGVKVAQLPVAISAPQWLEEQALADGTFALTLGLSLHLGSPPAITGSKLVVDVLTKGMKDLTGGTVHIESDATKAAEWMAGVIEEKRQALGVS